MSKNFELLQQIGKEQEMFHLSEPSPDAFSDTEQLPPLPVTSDNAGVDEVSALVQRVFLISGNETPRTVLFTGSEAGSGCSWMCARAGEALAGRISGSVCIVDANLHAPSLHAQTGIPNHHGLSDALLESGPISSFVTQLSPNLSIVSCGSAVERGASLLTSNRMLARLNELNSMFNHVLVDAPAMNGSREAVLLGAACDGVILILKAHSSRRETARGAVREFQTAKVRVLGAVLNQRTFPIPSSIYNRL